MRADRKLYQAETRIRGAVNIDLVTGLSNYIIELLLQTDIANEEELEYIGEVHKRLLSLLHVSNEFSIFMSANKTSKYYEMRSTILQEERSWQNVYTTYSISNVNIPLIHSYMNIKVEPLRAEFKEVLAKAVVAKLKNETSKWEKWMEESWDKDEIDRESSRKPIMSPMLAGYIEFLLWEFV